MLPDLRAVLAATIATVGLLMLAFGAVAAFRVAQSSHGALQADLTKRTRMAELAPPAHHPIRVIDTPGPHIAPFPPLPVREVKDAPIASVLIDRPGPAPAEPLAAPPEQPPATVPTPEPPIPPVAAAPPAPAPAAPAQPAAPPGSPNSAIGGPFAEPRIPTEAERAAAKAERARKLAAAKKARAARLARQRKAAARRAALARAKQLQSQQATSFNNNFGNSGFGSGFGQQPAQATARKSRPATARSDASFSPGGQQ